MTDRVVFLGTGTCELVKRRLASSVLVEVEGSRFVFDMGRGIAGRIRELGYLQNDIRHLVLSHFHPDHFSDLIPYLHAAAKAPTDLRTEDLHIYGPVGVEDLMEKVFSLCGFQRPNSKRRFRIHLHSLRTTQRIGDLEVETASLPPADNVGVRFRLGRKTIAITGDSAFHQYELDFLHRVDLAVIDSGHLTSEEIVELAVRARPKWILCSHVYRDLDAHSLSVQARRRGFSGRIGVAEDRMVIEL